MRWYGHGLFVKEVKPGHAIRAPKVYRIQQGDFVYNRLFAWKGSFAIAASDSDGCYVSNEFPCFAVDQEALDSGFLKWWFARESAWLQALGLSFGATPTSRNRLKRESLLGMAIPLPPLPEQRRIVARIEELAAKIAEARGLRKQAGEQSQLLVSRVTEAVFEQAAKTHGKRPLRTCVKVQGGFAFKSEEYLDHGLPIIRIANLEDEAVHVNGSPCMSPQRLHQFSRFVLTPGDVLIAMTGATTGKLGVVPSSCQNWLLNQRVGRFLPLSRVQLEQKYVYWLARGVQKRIFKTAYGGAQPNISPTDIEDMEFPFPLIQEQRRIVAELDALQSKVDALKRLHSETAAELDALLPSILDRAFKGEL